MKPLSLYVLSLPITVVSGWTQLSLQRGGRSGATTAFILRAKDDDRELELQRSRLETSFVIHNYLNILDEKWAPPDDRDDINLSMNHEIVTTASIYGDWTDAGPCRGEECEVSRLQRDSRFASYWRHPADRGTIP